MMNFKKILVGRSDLLNLALLAALVLVLLPLTLDIFRLNLVGKYLTFAVGCGIAGIAGAAFTTIASTGPTTGTLYIVDTFLVVVFGGAASLFGTIASAFSIAQAQSVLEFIMTGSMAKVLTLVSVVVILMMRPEGLFSIKVRK